MYILQIANLDKPNDQALLVIGHDEEDAKKRFKAFREQQIHMYGEMGRRWISGAPAVLGHEEPSIPNIVLTIGEGSVTHEYRHTIFATSIEELLDKWGSYLTRVAKDCGLTLREVNEIEWEFLMVVDNAPDGFWQDGRIQQFRL